MSETQTALAHALSYDLSLREGYSHGQAVATWLPYVAAQACDARPEIRQLLQTTLETEREPAEFLREWLAQFSIAPRTLSDLAQGQDTLTEALSSARGKNQIAAEGS